MATFTMYLKDVIASTNHHIGLDSYPIFDDTYRAGLNLKIEQHFWLREIGTETVDMFIFMLARKMNEVMPLYNQLYRSQALELNPFVTFSSTMHATTGGNSVTEATSNTTAGNTSASDSKSRTVQSDTPQTMLSGSEDYASGAADAISHASSDGTATQAETAHNAATQSGSNDATSTGFNVPLSALLLQYRETFLNIDMLVIAELEPLFMQLWSNGDEFTPGLPYFGGFFGGVL